MSAAGSLPNEGNSNSNVGGSSSGGGHAQSAFLRSLNAAQLRAATAPPTSSLQILAGPGSGKTRVLTARVAWLVDSQGLAPEECVVVTFTNKAANEMKSRLAKLLGQAKMERLVLGTFHATCAKYLRKYGKLVGLQNNFSILDATESKSIMKKILKDMESDLQAEGISLKPEAVLSEISKAKAHDVSAAEYLLNATAAGPQSTASQRAVAEGKGKGKAKEWRGGLSGGVETKLAVATVYERYQDSLKDSNSLDFDDLLVWGVRLLTDAPQVVRGIRHVLVDEFQDTNHTQYALMTLFAQAARSVSIVGDPDQSIYGWRSAEVGNLDRMRTEFGDTQEIFLEENYRSTGAILEGALRVVEQDTARIPKSLYTSHPRGASIVLRPTQSAQAEATFVAGEIKRLIAHTGGLLGYDDFAILLRFNALSRAVEGELQREGIASRMIGGNKFFERMEVKDLLAYLSLADNPGFTPGFLRVINVPKRGLGDKSVADVVSTAASMNLKPMELAEMLATGRKRVDGIKPAVRKALVDFAKLVQELRRMAKEARPVSEIIERLIKKVDYKSHLQKEQDFESRWENVQELINFSALVAQGQGQTVELPDLLEEEMDGDGPEPEFDSALGTDNLLSSNGIPHVGNQISHGFVSGKAALQAVGVKEEDDLSQNGEFGRGMLKRSASPEGAALKPEAVDEAVHAGMVEQGAVPGQSSEQNGGRRKRAKRDGKAKKEEIIVISDSDDEPIASRQRAKRAVRPKEEVSAVSIAPTPEAKMSSPTSDSATPDPASGTEKTPLRVFLEASVLSTDVEAQDDNGKEGAKVTISTCHAAKGLEWPVVFVLAVEEGSYPFYRCTLPHEIDEERRLLYVAMTRAATFLYMTHTTSRLVAGERQEKMLSPFVKHLVPPKIQVGLFSKDRPEITPEMRKEVAKVIERPEVDEQWTKRTIEEFEKTRTAALIRAPEPEPYLRAGRTGYVGGFGAAAGGDFGGGFGSGFGRPWGAGNLRSMSTTSASGFNSDPSRALQADLPGSSQSGVSAPPGFTRPRIGSFASALSEFDVVPSNPAVQQKRAPARPVRAAPSFTDEVRLRTRPEDAVEFARPDGTAPRARADLLSFQSAHKSSLSSLKDLLPDDAPTYLSPSSASDLTSASRRAAANGSGSASGSRGGAARRRLGMGMARSTAPTQKKGR